MKVCIRCNPVSELVSTPEGLRCPIHGDAYLLEEQPDPTPGPAPLPEQSPIEEPEPEPAPIETPAE